MVHVKGLSLCIVDNTSSQNTDIVHAVLNASFGVHTWYHIHEHAPRRNASRAGSLRDS